MHVLVQHIHRTNCVWNYEQKKEWEEWTEKIKFVFFYLRFHLKDLFCSLSQLIAKRKKKCWFWCSEDKKNVYIETHPELLTVKKELRNWVCVFVLILIAPCVLFSLLFFLCRKFRNFNLLSILYPKWEANINNNKSIQSTNKTLNILQFKPNKTKFKEEKKRKETKSETTNKTSIWHRINQRRARMKASLIVFLWLRGVYLHTNFVSHR